MTFSQQFLESIYTSKDGNLTAYQVGKLNTSGKHCLIRLNKASENGLSLTVVDIASNQFTSKVSKSGAEKGVKPIVFEVDTPILADINAAIQKDGKDSDEKKQIESIIAILNGKKIIPGKIYFANLDFLAIPASGLRAKAVKAVCEDDEDEPENYFYVSPPLETVDDIQAIVEKHGYSANNWSAAYALLSGSSYQEPKAYQQRKTFRELLNERCDAINSLTQEDISKLSSITAIYSEDPTVAFQELVKAWLINI